MDEPKTTPDVETSTALASARDAPGRAGEQLIIVEALRNVEATLQTLEQIRQENAAAALEKLHDVEAALQALEQSQQKDAATTTETLRGVSFRMRTLEQGQRGADERLASLESQRVRVDIVWVAVTAFLAGLAVGLAVGLF